LSIIGSDNQNVVGSKGVNATRFVAPRGSRLQEVIDQCTNSFNFFWRLILVPSMLYRSESQASTIECTAAVESLASILGTRQKPTIVKDL
jgi:hypothetical protein